MSSDSPMWNPAAERIFGWKNEEVMGRPLPIVHEERPGEFRLLLKILMQNIAKGTSIWPDDEAWDGAVFLLETSEEAPPPNTVKHWLRGLLGVKALSIVFDHQRNSRVFLHERDLHVPGLRVLTVSYGSTGTQNVDETVANWRNVSPCGP